MAGRCSGLDVSLGRRVLKVVGNEGEWINDGMDGAHGVARRASQRRAEHDRRTDNNEWRDEAMCKVYGCEETQEMEEM